MKLSTKAPNRNSSLFILTGLAARDHCLSCCIKNHVRKPDNVIAFVYIVMLGLTMKRNK